MSDWYVEWHKDGEDYKSGDKTEAEARAHFRRVSKLKGTTWAALIERGRDSIEDTFGTRSHTIRDEHDIEDHLLHQEAVSEGDDPPNIPPEGDDYPSEEVLVGAIDRAFEGLHGRNGRKQPVEPDPAYEGAHCTAHDLIQRLVEKLHDLPAPDGGYVKWHHVKIMNDVNRALFLLIEIVEKATECGT
jgi:hypothetical protein